MEKSKFKYPHAWKVKSDSKNFILSLSDKDMIKNYLHNDLKLNQNRRFKNG